MLLIADGYDLSTNYLYIGFNNDHDGMVRQSGGSHDVSGHSVYMGTSTNTNGLYVLTNGEVTTGSAFCGYVGNGAVEQYGGKFTAAALSPDTVTVPDGLADSC